MTDMAEIQARVVEALEEVVPGARGAELDPALLLRDQIEIDSIDFLGFVLELERRFDVQVPARSYPLCATVEHAAECIAGLMGAKTP